MKTQKPVSKKANLSLRDAERAVAKFRGRSKPYTGRGIRRVPCTRCGKPSHHQWNACSLNGHYFGVCKECDIGLNRAALEYLEIPGAEQIIAEYAARIR